MDFAHIVNCVDLSDADIRAALLSSEDAQALFAHLGKVSAHGKGAAKTLLLLSQMGTNACLWFEGDLVIDIVGDEDACVIEVMSELGVGMRERIFPSVGFHAKLSEFETAFERFPKLVFPLAVAHRNRTRLTLRVAESVRKSTAPPPPIRLSEASMLAAKPVHIPKHTPLPILAVIPVVDDQADERTVERTVERYVDPLDERMTPEPPTRPGENLTLAESTRKINELDELDKGWD